MLSNPSILAVGRLCGLLWFGAGSIHADVDRILFVKRQRARANHMCDQFFGFNAVRGGGLFTLSGVFGPAPLLRDVLADATVEAGRLQGQSLAGGAFLAPDLSFDGKEILFAHSECKPGRWDPQTSWHLFKVNTDGTGLKQLTDGTWNDFDPCWLPNGRIAFISERRGGFGRCHGRPVPTYTLHGVQADGSNLATLSFHETNEWQPSVTNDGRIIYTRWDYVDRDSDIAHHPWVPLRARPAPPVLPAQTQGTLLANVKPDTAPEPGIVTVSTASLSGSTATPTSTVPTPTSSRKPKAN